MLVEKKYTITDLTHAYTFEFEGHGFQAVTNTDTIWALDTDIVCAWNMWAGR